MIVPFLILFAISIAILVGSMALTSSAMGGIDFGQVHTVLLKGAGLLLVVNGLELLPYGIWLTLPVWWFGLMLLFGIDFWEARTLVVINWVLNLIAYFMIVTAFTNLAIA
jgi:hypothetical protein